MDKDHDGNVTVLEFLQGIGAMKHDRKSRLSAGLLPRTRSERSGVQQREEYAAVQGHLHHVSRASMKEGGSTRSSRHGRLSGRAAIEDAEEMGEQLRAARASAFQQEAEAKSRASVELANIRERLIKVARASAADVSAVAAAHDAAIEAAKEAEARHAAELHTIRDHLNRLSTRLSASGGVLLASNQEVGIDS